MNYFNTIKTYTYENYIEKVASDLEKNLMVLDPTDDIITYTQLNQKRMSRLDKTIVLNSDLISSLQNLSSKYCLYVISEGWCGDAAQILPVLNKMVTLSSMLELKIFFRDENLEIMDRYLTNGSRSIPKVIIVNEDLQEVAIWGPRPQEATNLVLHLKNEFGGMTSEVKEGLQKWYNNNNGIDVVKEILELLN